MTMHRRNTYILSPFSGLALIALACLLLAGGCATRHSDDSHRAVFVAPEGDDGPPLTPAERAVLQTPSKIDAGAPVGVMSEVVRQYKYFLRKGRGVMASFSKRSEAYLSFARQVFRSRGMPEELAYLAIVESGYRVDAKSPVGAAGAWQFMPATGRQYGLTLDWWLDERLDPYESTEAAAAYLQKLYGYFGDWPTAVAAYNAGEGKIGKALEGTGGRNFFEVVKRNHMLDDKARLKEETQKYVPRFIAVTKIMNNLPALGFEPIHPERTQCMLRYTAQPGTDLAGLAEACRLSRSELAVYNRHHRRPVTSTAQQSFVYLPAVHDRQASGFLRSSRTYAGWQPVSVRSSADSWEKISRRARVPVETLKALNPGNARLQAGQTILVPRNVDMSAAAVAALDKRGKPRAGQKAAGAVTRSDRTLHTVRNNDSLWAIARRYSVSVDDLKRWNNVDEKTLRVGTSLVVMQ
ncbi:MAG: transglycosylase SLT domain-containing protein [Desulfovibrio sp.]|jgi:membrane-bound lytic murein transglycosylase D|nr:transglycosylase SLT domain-containing protein [Desulfovibrio sp.]